MSEELLSKCDRLCRRQHFADFDFILNYLDYQVLISLTVRLKLVEKCLDSLLLASSYFLILVVHYLMIGSYQY